jgi:lysophospholipase L1-like esterase
MSTTIRSLLVLVGLTLCIGLIPGQGTSPKARNHQQWAKEIAKFEASDTEQMPPKQAILFAGSSSIVYWKTKQSFPDLVTINRGFGGSHLSDSVYYAQQCILKYEPSIVLVYAGDNDLAQNIPPAQIKEEFVKLTKLIHDKLPKTRILYIAIKPSPKRWALFKRQQKTNQMIMDICKSDERLQFVDIVKPMLDAKGQPRAELYMDDKLHLNEKGYELWTSIIRPLLTVKQ